VEKKTNDKRHETYDKGMHLRPHVLQKELKFIPRSLIILIWP